MNEPLSNYARRDHEVVDYSMYELAPTGLQFRGPERPLTEGGYVSCLGAAQTFGCFCETPYPALLEQRLGVPMLNLGYGGAGPRFFARQEALLEIVNRGRCAIVQVMSGRSEDNSRFESRGHERITRKSDGRQLAADEAWWAVLELGYAWRWAPVGRGLARQACRKLARPAARRLADETRANYVESFGRLLNQVRVPVVLLWFSRRTPEYTATFENVERFFGAFPQLIDRPTIDAIRPAADAYVECVTERGMPQPLVSRFTGEPVEIDLAEDREDFQGRVWTANRYYPSPEMHADAAEALTPVLAELLG